MALGGRRCDKFKPGLKCTRNKCLSHYVTDHRCGSHCDKTGQMYMVSLGFRLDEWGHIKVLPRQEIERLLHFKTWLNCLTIPSFMPVEYNPTPYGKQIVVFDRTALYILCMQFICHCCPELSDNKFIRVSHVDQRKL